VIECASPDRLARFWAAAPDYQLEPPGGLPTWDDYWRDVGVGEDDLSVGEDSITDPDWPRPAHPVAAGARGQVDSPKNRAGIGGIHRRWQLA
jgi:hypothetical protein